MSLLILSLATLEIDDLNEAEEQRCKQAIK